MIAGRGRPVRAGAWRGAERAPTSPETYGDFHGLYSYNEELIYNIDLSMYYSCTRNGSRAILPS